jgi:HPr kinase/phosphorylase
VGLVVDLAAPDAERLPLPNAGNTDVNGIILPRLAVAAETNPLPLVLAALRTNTRT